MGIKTNTYSKLFLSSVMIIGMQAMPSYLWAQAVAECGDGITSGDEQCDNGDGNNDGLSGCTSECKQADKWNCETLDASNTASKQNTMQQIYDTYGMGDPAGFVTKINSICSNMASLDCLNLKTNLLNFRSHNAILGVNCTNPGVNYTINDTGNILNSLIGLSSLAINCAPAGSGGAGGTIPVFGGGGGTGGSPAGTTGGSTAGTTGGSTGSGFGDMGIGAGLPTPPPPGEGQNYSGRFYPTWSKSNAPLADDFIAIDMYQGRKPNSERRGLLLAVSKPIENYPGQGYSDYHYINVDGLCHILNTLVTDSSQSASLKNKLGPLCSSDPAKPTLVKASSLIINPTYGPTNGGTFSINDRILIDVIGGGGGNVLKISSKINSGGQDILAEYKEVLTYNYERNQLFLYPTQDPYDRLTIKPEGDSGGTYYQYVKDDQNQGLRSWAYMFGSPFK